MIKTCRWCNKEFEPNVPTRIYCSDSCRRAANNAKRRKRPKKMSPLDADVHLMSVCGIQYGKLQILRRQNLTDAEITERYSPRREKEELRCT